MEEKKMNPCALCGGEGELLKELDWYSAQCRNPGCGRRYGVFESEDAARDFWNKDNPVKKGGAVE